MSEYIDPAVRQFRDSTSDDEITLLIGVSGEQDQFTSRVEKLGVTIETKLGQATLRVTAPLSVIAEL